MAPSIGRVRSGLVTSASVLGLFTAWPALAQSSGQSAASESVLEEIIVTAQRQAESLQDVPIAVSAFSTEALERQQIDNTSDLQLTLPNITFTKSNFTSSNFSIRGIGSPVVAASSDQGVAIHVNDMPISAPRLFETEFFDLERVEVLRGPQGTLFGRNATGGVINFITARPTDEFEVRAEGEYANYDSIKAQGMINVPLGDMFGIRLAGFYLNRDGYTKNLFTGNNIDGRDQWAVRGTIRFEPTDNTTIDLIGYHFRENSDRSRIQKQLCNRDATAILGCSPDRLEFEPINANATLGAIVTSREFLGAAIALPSLAPLATRAGVLQGRLAAGVITPAEIAELSAIPGRIAATQGQLAPLVQGLGNISIYGADAFAGITNPADVRTVRIDYEPTYETEETIAMLKLDHDFGAAVLSVTGGYHEGRVRSRTDYNLTAANPQAPNPVVGLVLPAVAARLYQGSLICVSSPSRGYDGLFGDDVERCANIPTEFDESGIKDRQYSFEAHVDSQFDGPFNFLIGGIYVDQKSTDSNYFVVSNGLDYGSGVLGGISTLATPLAGAGFQASPFYNSETDRYRLKSYAAFGEAYYEFNDELKLTLGLRYTTDKKSVRDRQYLLNTPIPIGTNDAGELLGQRVDSDASIPGQQTFREASVKFDRLTGRAVLDWKPTTTWSDDTLVYASYSRGYKSGGVNPSFDPAQFTAPATFAPETVNAFEIGTKNRFGGGTFQANLTAFYYDYKDLQVSRIINRTSFNDNTDAEVYGVEGEFLISPAPPLLFNINASYLKTKIKDLQLVDARDPSAGRSDAVIIKDITNASNCVVAPTTTLPPGSAAAFVNGFNAGLNQLLNPVTGSPAAAGGTFRPATPIAGTNTVGAFSICSALANTIANPDPATRALFGVASGPLPFQLDAASAVPKLPEGVAADLSGNELQNSPNWKVSIGAQYTHAFANEMSLVARVDYAFTGEQWGRNFNRPLDKIDAYDVINAQVQLNGPESAWFVRAFVQNLENDDSIVGMYVTDPSSGLFTNIFTLEPRRYGIAAGFRF